MRYQFIEKYRVEFPVRVMCRVLEVSESGYYAARRRQPSVRAQHHKLLTLKIKAVFFGGYRSYGSPRMFRHLQAQSIRCSRHQVARLMRAAGLQARARHRRRVTTQSNHTLPVVPNVLERHFNVAQPQCVWAGDITYVATAAGWGYLAVVLDLCSRRVVGWALETEVDTDLVLKALNMALRQRALKGRVAPPLLFHSDRGCQYASRQFASRLALYDITRSMSRRGNCWDNAPLESFFSTLKTEMIQQGRFANLDEARHALFEYIELYYNRQRIHSSLGYKAPATFEKELWLAQPVAVPHPTNEEVMPQRTEALHNPLPNQQYLIDSLDH
jgi:transposase InsO family protein